MIAGEYLYPTGDGNVLTLSAHEMEAQLEEMRAHTSSTSNNAASRAEKMRERRRFVLAPLVEGDLLQLENGGGLQTWFLAVSVFC